MAVYQVTAPDGGTYEYSVPDDTSPDDVMAHAQQSFKPAAPEAQAPQNPGFFDRVGADIAKRQAETNVSAQQYNAGNQTLGEGLLQGIGQGAGFANDLTGEAFKSIGSGLNSLTGGYAGKAANNVLDSLAGTRVGRDMVGAKDYLASQYADFEKNNPRAARDINATTNIGLLGLSGTPVKGTSVVTAPMDAAAAGAKAVAVPAQYAARVAGSALAPTIPEDTALLAKRAADLNIPLSLDQIAPGNVRDTVQKISQKVPFSGVDQFQDAQRAAFNKALAGTIGQQSDSLGPATIKNFLADANTKFSSAIGTGDFQIQPEDFQKLSTLESALPRKVTNDIGDIVKNNIQQFKDDLTNSQAGTASIPAQKLASLRSELVQRLPTIDSQARPHVAELVNVIDDIAQRNITPQAAATLQQARREWRNFRTLEPLLEKSTTGQINPTDLLNRVAASPYIHAAQTSVGEDDLVDLARIGKMLAKKGGSDTAEKAAYLGAMGTGAFLNPFIAAKMGAGIAGNRALQSFYNQSPALLNATIKKSTNPLHRFYAP
jgi:hypothetical protein